MNKLYQSIYLSALVMVSFSAGAAKLVVTQGTANCEFELASGDAVSINPATGDVSAVVTNLEECAGAPEPPVITSFTVTPSVSPGGTIQLSWNTQEATGCQAVTTGVTSPLPGWSGSKAVPSGSQSITAPSPNTDTTYRARLECSNSAATVQETRTITVSDEPNECAINRPPPSGMGRANNGRQATGSSNTFCTNCGTRWTGMFDTNFGAGNISWYYQEPNTYHAIRFNTGPLPVSASGQVNFGEPANYAIGARVRNGRRFITFSQCPGDFHKSELGNCFTVNHGNGVSAWSGGGPKCILEPNTTYYLNIVHTNSPDTNPNPAWTCEGNDLGSNLRGCGATLSPTSAYGSGSD